MKINKLTQEEKSIIIDKGTEKPFKGKYNYHTEEGVYVCKQCGTELYDSSSKFDGHCGWPSFDDDIKGSVIKQLDVDGRRTEIVCSNCQGHLGHVFFGENYTKKNIRHCVNSLSINFIPQEEKQKEIAIFASGCFWGTEYWMEKQNGVISATSGYIGGDIENPTYEQVKTGNTKHVEAVKVVFDRNKITYEDLVKLFFETHDPTQINGQGPDIGSQYLSYIFYISEEQKQTSIRYKKILEEKGYEVFTKIEKATKFYKAEEYHQNYYRQKGEIPYCHIYKKKF